MARLASPSLAEVVESSPHVWSSKNTTEPSKYTNNSNELVWFHCNKCSVDYERKAKDIRLHPERCGVCAGKVIVPGVNDLATKLPGVLARWDYGLNERLPSEVGISYRSYFTCEVCKQSTIRMASSVASSPDSCSVCSGKVIVSGVNDLATLRSDLALQWGPKNTKTPEQVTLGSGYRATWECSLKHTWEAEVGTRVKFGYGCPFCAGQRAISGVNDILQYEEFAKTWDYDKNSADPSEVAEQSNRKFWWRCEKSGHSFERSPSSRLRHTSMGKQVAPCPHCQRGRISYGEVELFEFCKTLDESAHHSDRTILGGQEIDIVLPAHGVGIEYNGTYWHSDKVVLAKYGVTAEEYHKRKKIKAAEAGYRLYFVWALDWTRHKEEVKKAVAETVNTGSSVALLDKLVYKESPDSKS